jgi:hypothetical protein
MFLAGQARPAHKAIGEFRRRHLVAFSVLFLGSLVLCREAGMVKLGRVALDGTKVKANASRHTAMSYARMAERETALEAQVAAILAEAEAVDAAEDARYGDARGDELPAELRTLEGKLRQIREAKAALEAEALERTGDPDAVPDPKAQRNFTDPESRIMLSKPDGFIYGYNAQAVVDEAHQVSVATDLGTRRPTRSERRCRNLSCDYRQVRRHDVTARHAPAPQRGGGRQPLTTCLPRRRLGRAPTGRLKRLRGQGDWERCRR